MIEPTIAAMHMRSDLADLLENDEAKWTRVDALVLHEVSRRIYGDSWPWASQVLYFEHLNA